MLSTIFNTPLNSRKITFKWKDQFVESININLHFTEGFDFYLVLKLILINDHWKFCKSFKNLFSHLLSNKFSLLMSLLFSFEHNYKTDHWDTILILLCSKILILDNFLPLKKYQKRY